MVDLLRVMAILTDTILKRKWRWTVKFLGILFSDKPKLAGMSPSLTLGEITAKLIGKSQEPSPANVSICITKKSSAVTNKQTGMEIIK